MGLRLDWILVIGILGLIALTAQIKLHNTSKDKKSFHKELEFTQSTFIEVNEKTMLSKTYGMYGVREKGILSLSKLKYSTDNIEELTANKGRFEGNILYLDGDVFMQEKDGYVYATQHAKYQQKTKILTLISPFTAVRDENIMYGDTLVYDVVKKESQATKINALVKTVDSE